MLVAIHATLNGTPTGRMQLRADQVLKVGRSGWTDFSIPQDRSLQDEHFEVRCEPSGCIVRALSVESPTHVNGEQVATTVVYDGDEIKAGKTTFKLTIQGGPVREEPEEPAMQPEASESTVSPVAAAVAVGAALSLAGVCAHLEFAEDLQPLAESAESADVLIDQLAQEKNFTDALKLRAYLLEKRQAVWWGCHCLREELDAPLAPKQNDAVDAAAAWVAEPSESNRRMADVKATAANYSGPGATLALSAFWSDGSLAPEDNPEVPADERLTAQGVAAALITAAYLGDPVTAPQRLQAFLERGRDVAEGKIALPE